MTTHVILRRAAEDEPKLEYAQHLYVSGGSPKQLEDGTLEYRLETIDLKATGLLNRLKKMIGEELKDRELVRDEEIVDAMFHIRALERIVGLVMIREQQDREHQRKMDELRNLARIRRAGERVGRGS